MRRILLPLLAMLIAAAPLAAFDPRLSVVGAAWAQDDDDDDDGGGGGDDDDDNGGSGGGGNQDDDDNGGGAGGGQDDDDDDGGSAGGSDDDDDDSGRQSRGGGGDDDDRGRRASRSEGGGFSLRDLFRPRERRRAQEAPQRAAPAPTPPPPPPPAAAPAEIVTFDLSGDDLATLLAQGYVVVEEQVVAGFGTTSRRLSVPAGVSLAEARDAVRALPTGQDADFNHYYRVEQGEGDGACDGLHCPAFELIGWPLAPSRRSACGGEVAVGMIDTGINPDHETFAGSGLELHRLSDEALEASAAVHGTAVAAILVGSPDSRSPGLIPHTRLVAVDAFHRVRADERADVFTLVEALGFLAEEGVRVINLSLSGPANTVLERTVDELVVQLGIVLVAAAGNAGPQADPAYPAAYAPVIAVTAVDRFGQVYRRAGRGPHIDLAAPGIEVWTAASVSGARWKTGTSFAAPFVSAAAALILQEEPELEPADVAARLSERARDLGEPGSDPIYGAGLLALGDTCRGVSGVPAMLVD